MKNYFKSIDQFAEKLSENTIQYRYYVLITIVAVVIIIGSGVRYLDFSTNYRDFFSEANPELQAFEDLQTIYSKNDNIIFVLEPQKNTAFSSSTLSAVEWLTHEAWQIPYAQRVDSVSNFQHTYSQGDDLIVENLVENAKQLTPAKLAKIKNIALTEPLLYKQLVSENGKALAVNITLNYPQKTLMEVPDSVAKARALTVELNNMHPNIKVSLSGVSMLNNAFSEAGFKDMSTLVPIMFAVILVLTLLIIRSFAGTFATIFVILFSTAVGMGMAGFFGIKLTPISASAPTIILTLAVADSLHILISLRKNLWKGMNKNAAIVESVRVNFLPITITSLTTIIGFLALNFSDSPPFWHLGNITAMGIFAAWILSLILLPILVSIFPVQKPKSQSKSELILNNLGEFVVSNPKKIIVSMGLACIVLISFIPKIEFNDQWSEYFDESIKFRQDTDQLVKNFGIYPVEFSLPASAAGEISSPEYLLSLEKFTTYLKSQDLVKHVYSYSEIIKRLNQNLHGDDPGYYKIPTEANLAAQYLLFYQMSLPYGLDLNDRINIDKSATRVTATLGNSSTAETKEFLNNTTNWIKQNLPDYMHSTIPTSTQVMFTYIADRNVSNMIAGTIGAIVAISLILMLSLMSWRLGLLSLIPNGLPILTTFGVWAILVGEVGFSVATVASISLGIIVDDTVHFLSKYVRARSEKGLNAAESVIYAYRNVGVAILVNTVILTCGFLVLTTSTFKVNYDMGMLTSMAIVFALILDFLLLPALLVIFDKKNQAKLNTTTGNKTMSKETKTASLMISILLITGLISSPIMAQDTSSKEESKGYQVSARSDRSDNGFSDSEVKVTMILRNKAGQESSRSMTFTTLEVASESVGDKSLVLFNTPKDVEGTALLSHAKILKQDDQWLFLPALKRVKRISSKSKSGPFVGSEFAFEDFTANELNKYDYQWLREETCDEVKCDVVERIPLYEFSGYTRQIAWIDQTDFQLRKIDFYDRKNTLLKTLTFMDYRNYDGVWRAHNLHMENAKNGKSTDLIYAEYTFKAGLTDNDFVKGRLSNLR
ncbi:MAG: outer membrane lipoprotein-sorting protein [Xanthomonadales bacterium]|nr:outer membrane lipoprotein-sorting protein [Xanthomonadales bacterium]